MSAFNRSRSRASRISPAAAYDEWQDELYVKMDCLPDPGVDVEASVFSQALVNFAYGNDRAGMIALLNSASGAEVNLHDCQYEFPLHAACSVGALECVQELLYRGADPSRRDKRGYLPMCIAAGLLHSSAAAIVRLLKRSGASVNLANSSGLTPFHAACSAVNIETAQALVEMGACFRPIRDAAALVGSGDSWHYKSPEQDKRRFWQWLSALEEREQLGEAAIAVKSAGAVKGRQRQSL